MRGVFLHPVLRPPAFSMPAVSCWGARLPLGALRDLTVDRLALEALGD
jgi:hypothetical protein